MSASGVGEAGGGSFERSRTTDSKKDTLMTTVPTFVPARFLGEQLSQACPDLQLAKPGCRRPGSLPIGHVAARMRLWIS